MQQNMSELSRRKVTAGLAWSVPAVAVAASAPAFAASPVCVVATSGEVTKYPGGSSRTGIRQGYGFPIVLTNNTRNVVRVSTRSVSIAFNRRTANGTLYLYSGDPCQGGVRLNNNSAELELGPGESRNLYLVADRTGNSSNRAGCIDAVLAVRLANPSVPPIGDLCAEVDVSRACFSATPPVGC